jgi:hypothetical protein
LSRTLKKRESRCNDGRLFCRTKVKNAL